MKTRGEKKTVFFSLLAKGDKRRERETMNSRRKEIQREREREREEAERDGERYRE